MTKALDERNAALRNIAPVRITSIPVNPASRRFVSREDTPRNRAASGNARDTVRRANDEIAPATRQLVDSVERILNRGQKVRCLSQGH